jgi:NAD(P)-dependent dehydrogenase (short-subunit alcohol dehydrogenase family)
MQAPTESPATPAAALPFAPGLFRETVAVVTGGASGLGLELSRALAHLGATVLVPSRDEKKHEPLLAEAARRGWKLECAVLDVRDNHAVDRYAAAMLERHGRVDLLVNNAAGNFVCPSERLSANAWRAVLGIALDGTFYCSKAFGRGMLKARRGAILNIVATYAWTGMPGVVHSASAKAGVLAMTKTMAAEWAGRGVRVNAIAPGPFHSKGAKQNLWPDETVKARMEKEIPLGRFGTAEEVAAHCLWLLAPQSSWVTGECFVVDGGGSLGKGMWLPGERLASAKDEA